MMFVRVRIVDVTVFGGGGGAPRILEAFALRRGARVAGEGIVRGGRRGGRRDIITARWMMGLGDVDTFCLDVAVFVLWSGSAATAAVAVVRLLLQSGGSRVRRCHGVDIGRDR